MLSLLTMVGRLISTENPVVCIHFLFPLSIISLIFSVHQFGKGGTTLALQNGVDVKTVSSILGHFSAGFTLDTYAHVTTTAQREAAKKMDGVLGQRVP